MAVIHYGVGRHTPALSHDQLTGILKVSTSPPLPPRWTVLTKTVYTSARNYLRGDQRADQSGPVDDVLPHLHLSQGQVGGADHRLPFGLLDAVRHHPPARPVQADREDMESLCVRGTYFRTPPPSSAASAPHTPSGCCCY